jgi:hypothetical protein
MMKTNEQHIFDDPIRAALSEYEVAYKAEHWQQMTAELDALDAEEADFDASLRGRLADVSRVPQFGDWSKMSSILDDLGNDDVQFDASLRDKLENLNRRFQPNHWDMMNERLDRELTWRGKIVRYKIAEVAMMLLLLLTVANTLDWANRTEGGKNGELEMLNGESRAKTEAGNVPNAAKSSAKPLNFSKNTPSTQPSTQPSTTPKPAQNDPAAWRLRRGLPSQIRPADAPVAKGAQPIVMQNMPSQERVLESNTANFSEKVFENNSDNTMTVATAQHSNTNDTPNSETANTQNVAAESASIAQVETLNALPLGTTNLLKNNALTALPAVEKRPVEKKSGWNLSGALSWATDFVTASYSEDRELKSKKQVATNAGVGAKIAYRHNSAEIETGLVYNTKSYESPLSDVVTGSFANYRSVKTTDNLRMSIVSIPLSINASIVKKKRWDITARLGTALNVITHLKQPRIVTYTNPNAQGPSPNTDSEPNTYAAGLLQKGGKWSDNARISTNIGFGVEYRLTPRTSVFVQPQGEFMFNKGIGVMEDRYQTLNIQAGTKVRL